MNGRTRALEAELSGEIGHQQMKYSVEAGRDVMTDLTPWQKQALSHTEMFATKQGFRRHHPYRLLNSYGHMLNGENPRLGWEKAMEDEQERTEVSQTYKKTRNEMTVNQLGLVETAFRNFQASRARLAAVNMVGV